MIIYKCKNCGETKNLHYNYDYSKQERPVIDFLCNECGEFNEPPQTIEEIIEEKTNTDLFYYKQVMNPYSSESHSYTAYEHGFIDGWKKCEETLYSAEDLKKLVSIIRTKLTRNGYNHYAVDYDKLIKSLKQNPK